MLPLVSVITPTRARPAFLNLAAQWLESQSYQGRIEWIIVNSDSKPIERRPRFDRAVRRFERVTVLDRTGPTGFLRNEAIRLASGSIIVHVDDDDYQFPARVAIQVEALSRPGIELVCTDDFYIALLDEPDRRGQPSVGWGEERFSSGCSFAYKREAWKRHPFHNIQSGEDYVFAREHRTIARGACLNLRDPGLLVYVRHGGNTGDFDPSMREQASVATGEWIRGLMGDQAWFALSRAAATTARHDFDGSVKEVLDKQP